MKLPKFEVEQWMTDYENDAVCNLTDTCIPALTIAELLSYDTDDLFSHVTLDYGSITGDLRLKDEILKLYETGTVDHITTSQGCLQGNELVMNTLLEPGDHVIAFQPGYQAFTDYPKSLGCKVTAIDLLEENRWQPELSDIEAAMREPVKLIILNNPNNPTGIRFDESVIEKIIALARVHSSWILSDEVYRDPSWPSLSDRYEKAVSVSSLSKMYSLAGLRFGWIKGPLDLIQKINERRDYSIISTGPLSDTLALIALRHRNELLERSRSIIRRNKAIVEEWLKTEPRCSVVLPDDCTVSFLSYSVDIPSRELSQRLLKETGVFFVPGDCFFHEHHLRRSLTADEDTMKKGLTELSRFFDQL